jgi:hypothetical protein
MKLSIEYGSGAPLARATLPASNHSETETQKLVVRCFSVASNPFFDAGFFVALCA